MPRSQLAVLLRFHLRVGARLAGQVVLPALVLGVAAAMFLGPDFVKDLSLALFGPRAGVSGAPPAAMSPRARLRTTGQGVAMLNFAEVEAHVRQLPSEQRARLAELLLESLAEVSSPSVAAAWEAEILARVAGYERGEVELIPAEDVLARARKLTE